MVLMCFIKLEKDPDVSGHLTLGFYNQSNFLPVLKFPSGALDITKIAPEDVDGFVREFLGEFLTPFFGAGQVSIRGLGEPGHRGSSKFWRGVVNNGENLRPLEDSKKSRALGLFYLAQGWKLNQILLGKKTEDEFVGEKKRKRKQEWVFA